MKLQELAGMVLARRIKSFTLSSPAESSYRWVGPGPFAFDGKVFSASGKVVSQAPIDLEEWATTISQVNMSMTLAEVSEVSFFDLDTDETV